MESYLNQQTEYGWYLCIDGDRSIGGLGVIENDFHDRIDLAPNVCAVDTAGNLCVWFRAMMRLIRRECIFTDKFKVEKEK